MDDKIEPIRMFFAAFGIASFGGLAALLRSQKPITIRSLVAAVMYSGLAGLIIMLLWYNYFLGNGNLYFLLGVSGLAGVGGTTVVDFLLQAFKSGGLNLTFGNPARKDVQDDKDQES